MGLGNMPKLKKPFSILIIFLVFLFLIVLGISTYLLASGVRVKYDSSQKRYVLDASKNEFVKNLLLKYSKDLLVIDEKPNGITNTTNIKVEQATNPYN